MELGLFHGLRGRLYLVLLLVFVPIFGLTIFVAYEEFQEEMAAAKSNAAALAGVLASEQSHAVAAAHQLLLGLSRLGEVRDPTAAAACSNLFARLVRVQPQYFNLGVIQLDGHVSCSGLPFDPKVDLSDRSYFRRAIKSGDFAVGDFQIGRITHQGSLNFAFPVFDDQDRARAVVFAAFNLKWLGEMSVGTERKAGQNVIVLDSRGTVLAADPGAGEQTGQTVTAEPLRRIASRPAAKGIVSGFGPTGERMIYAYSALTQASPHRVFVVVGQSETVANHLALLHLLRNALILAGLAALALVTARVGSTRLLIGPLHALMSAARDLAKGRLGARTGLSNRDDEIGQLAVTFDAMATSIEHRETELERTQRALSALSASNRALVRATDEISLVEEFCRLIVAIGGYRMAWVGYAQHDEARSVRIVSIAGHDEGYAQSLNLTWRDTARGQGPTGTAIRTGRPMIVQDIRNDPMFAPWREEAIKRGFGASMSLPLKAGSECFGVISIYAQDVNTFSERELEVIEELADDLAFGIVGQRLRQAHRQAEDTIRRLAYFDPLTGLVNRTCLVQRLVEVITAGKANARLTLLSLDLDRFSEINSALGYTNGNRLLQEIGRRLQHGDLGADIVARSGEDEFALLFSRQDGDERERIADKVQSLLESPINLDGIDVRAQASIGIAHYGGDGEDADSFLRHAVIARDYAKAHSTGVSVYHGNTEMEDRKRIALIADLHKAIGNNEDNELTLAFQPKQALSSGRLCGAEVLVRWRHPHRGMVPPVEFINLAEHTGLIKPLTDWILETAISQQVRWRNGPAETPVAVNLSARNLHDPHLLTHIEMLLNRWEVPPSSLQVEITESTLMEDPGGARDILVRLSERGIQIYIDDFGTGYSSLSYLATLPVHGVKIDRSFVNEMMYKHEQRTIVATVISLAHALGLAVVAEGVETHAQYEMLQSMGCDQAQGYLLSPPLPPDAFEDWCRTHDECAAEPNVASI